MMIGHYEKSFRDDAKSRRRGVKGNFMRTGAELPPDPATASFRDLHFRACVFDPTCLTFVVVTIQCFHGEYMFIFILELVTMNH